MCKEETLIVTELSQTNKTNMFLNPIGFVAFRRLKKQEVFI